MAKRKSPPDRSMMIGPMDMDKHEKMLGEMHDALYTLAAKIRPPMSSSGDKLLPVELRPAEPEGAKVARSHIEKLHRAMKGKK